MFVIEFLVGNQSRTSFYNNWLELLNLGLQKNEREKIIENALPIFKK